MIYLKGRAMLNKVVKHQTSRPQLLACLVLDLMFIPLVLLICSGCVTNPVTGKEQLMLISPAQEIEIGRKYAPEIEKQMGGRIQNSILQNYILLSLISLLKYSLL